MYIHVYHIMAESTTKVAKPQGTSQPFLSEKMPNKAVQYLQWIYIYHTQCGSSFLLLNFYPPTLDAEAAREKRQNY